MGEDAADIWLFSYGTLRQKNVQLATFGRELEGRQDALVGFARSMIAITVPEPRMVLVNVWDKALVNAVDRAIRNSGLGINPQMDGTILRLPIPELNEERRRDLAKVAGHYAEQARVAIRNVRRDGMDQLKRAKSAGMAEDDNKLWHDEIQELTDAAKVDAALTSKQEEIMQI